MSQDYGVWINCNGGPYSIDNPRGLSWSIPSGWAGVIDRLIPLCEGRIVLIHNPFGRTTKEGLMEFDQYFNCQRLAATKALVESFNDNIGRLVSVAQSVVVYIGAPHNSQRMIQAVNTPEAKGVDNWQYQWWYNLQPIIESGCSVGIDNMGKVDLPVYELHHVRGLQSLLQTHGREVWIEATTEFNSPLHNQFPMFVTNESFQGRHVLKNALSRFPNIANQATWYKQQIGVLLRSGDYADSELLNARLDLLRSAGVLPMLQFSMLGSK